MARDRASIRIDIWADDDWRDLTDGAQFLYFQILSHSSLSYAGVADWRPGRLAMMSKGVTADIVRARADELQAHAFVLVDDESEEVLIRSFVKHDGILKQPKLAVSMANAYAGIASRKIREVVAFEVQKAHERDPSLSCWQAVQVQTILGAKASGIESFTRPVTPALTPAVTPSGDQPQALPTYTGTNTGTSPKGDRRATRLPNSWSPSEACRKYAHENRIDLAHEVGQFKAHAEANARTQKNWDAAFRQWLGNAKKWTKEAGSVVVPQRLNGPCNHRWVGGYCAECSVREPA